jgi:23S rRNA (guanosine2251-2'-O)-methyltransferase
MPKNQKQNHVGEIIYGFHPIYELLKAKRRTVSTIYTTNPVPKVFNQLKDMLPKYSQVKFVTKQYLSELAQCTDHQNIVAMTTSFQLRKKPFTPEQHPFLVLLDGIQDARNLGAILRSAYCTNISGVVLTEYNSASLNAPAHKAAAGLAEYLEIMKYPNTITAVRDLKKSGYHIYLATMNGANPLIKPCVGPLCLVIGSEGPGISPEITGLGTPVSLPQKRADISYNASVAAGILLFTLATQQKLLV